MNYTECPLVSIIVPFYNAHNTLERCIDSLQAQNYTNIEMILVDNNSIDDSSQIVQRKALTDKRIKLAICKTPGPAAARNCAITLCRGEWIMFVDHDDTMAEGAVSCLLSAVLESNVDFGCASYYLCNDDFSLKKTRSLPEFLSFEKEEIHMFFLSQGLHYNQAWGKIYKREIFDSVKYVEERFYEDISALPYILEVANGCRVLTEPIYFYFQEPDNITYSGNFDQQIDGLSARLDNCMFYKKEYPALTKVAYDACLEFSFFLLGKTFRNDTKESRETRNWVCNTIRTIIPKARKKGIKMKLAIFIFVINETLATGMFNLYSKIRNS